MSLARWLSPSIDRGASTGSANLGQFPEESLSSLSLPVL